jgi:hypothetical protein
MRALALAALICLAADVAAAQGDGPTILSEGNWDLKRSDAAPAQNAACLLTPRSRSRVQIGRTRLTITGLPKNSIFNYQYRIDDKPASTPVIPSAEMQNAGEIYLDGHVFSEILAGRRFQFRILDRWHEAIAEDVDLAGLSELHERMLGTCNENAVTTDVK